jgi:thioredoxin reductase (NADPH)
VFAVGDVRLGSIKRVGGAIGEGAMVVAQLHAFFEKTRGRAEMTGPAADQPLHDELLRTA